jgi:osmoprotectant transport system permease protein
MGLSDAQLLRKVQLPLSAPVILSGIRTATQQTIGTATLGVFVAAGTLGRPIFGGVSQTADDLVLLGSIALVALALSVDVVMRTLQRFATPRHLRNGR